MATQRPAGARYEPLEFGLASIIAARRCGADQGEKMLKRLFVAFALCAAIATPVSAHSVREMQLDEIIDTAAVAFEGTVIETHSEKDAASGRIVTYTTFAVTDVLKGNVGAKHTIKQLGGEVANGRDFDNLTERMSAEPNAAAVLAKKKGSDARKMGLAEFKQLVRAHLGVSR